MLSAEATGADGPAEMVPPVRAPPPRKAPPLSPSRTEGAVEAIAAGAAGGGIAPRRQPPRPAAPPPADGPRHFAWADEFPCCVGPQACSPVAAGFEREVTVMRRESALDAVGSFDVMDHVAAEA